MTTMLLDIPADLGAAHDQEIDLDGLAVEVSADVLLGEVEPPYVTGLVDTTLPDPTATELWVDAVRRHEIPPPALPPTPEAARLAQIRDKQREVDAAAADVESRKEDLKDAKLAWEQRVSELGLLIKQDLEELPLFDRVPATDFELHVEHLDGRHEEANTPSNENAPQTANDVEGARPGCSRTDQSTAREEPPQQDAWRSVPLAEVGLRPKLHERLTEFRFSLIGQLEEFRSHVSKGIAKWPKGIGPAKVTEIENALASWLMKWHAERGALAVIADDVASQIEERADELGNEINEGKPLHRHSAGPQILESGIEAKRQGMSLLQCPYQRPGTSQDDWILGWLFATNDSEPSETPPPGLTSTTVPAGIAKHDPHARAAGDDLLAVKARAKELNDGKPNCLDQKLSDAAYWESGHRAFKKEWPITDCPYIPGPQQDDWLRGWMAAEMLENYEPAQTTETTDQ